MSDLPDWPGADRVYPLARAWMKRLMDAHFAAWCQTKAGKRWKKLRAPRPSPYTCGFSVRGDCAQMAKALDEGDEETIKSFLLNYPDGRGAT